MQLIVEYVILRFQFCRRSLWRIGDFFFFLLLLEMQNWIPKWKFQCDEVFIEKHRIGRVIFRNNNNNSMRWRVCEIFNVTKNKKLRKELREHLIVVLKIKHKNVCNMSFSARIGSSLIWSVGVWKKLCAAQKKEIFWTEKNGENRQTFTWKVSLATRNRMCSDKFGWRNKPKKCQIDECRCLNLSYFQTSHSVNKVLNIHSCHIRHSFPFHIHFGSPSGIDAFAFPPSDSRWQIHDIWPTKISFIKFRFHLWANEKKKKGQIFKFSQFQQVKLPPRAIQILKEEEEKKSLHTLLSLWFHRSSQSLSYHYCSLAWHLVCHRTEYNQWRFNCYRITPFIYYW